MNTRIKTTIGFALAAIILLFMMASSNISTSKFIDDSQWVVHTVQVRSEIEELLTEFMTAQNNIRGYHMTEQAYYLGLHNNAMGEIRKSLANLQVLIRDNPSQQANLARVKQLMEAKLALWEKSFDLRQTKGFEYLRGRMLLDEGKNRDEELFEAVDAFKKEENHLMDLRTERAEAQGRKAKIVASVGGGLVGLLISLATYLVYRDGRRREMAEAQIDRFFTLSLDLLCISGMDGYFKRLSPSYSEVLGYPLQELYTTPILDLIHPDDIDKTSVEIANQMRGHKVLFFENRFRCKNGDYKIFSWKSVPVGQFMYAVARDVTQQKTFEMELMDARETAQNATTAKAAFLANMSHEIRTPLNGVIGMTDLLARTQLNGEQKNFVNIIRTSSAGLLTIVNEILDFSKIEAGRAQLEQTDFDLVQLIEGRISLLGVLAHERGLRLEAALDSRMPRILRGDSGKVGQILLNLLNNAVKFTAKGTIVVRAEVLAHHETHCEIKVSVDDSGIGMSPDQIARLFQPFMQADTSTERKYGGTGLGLSICKRFVELMGGTIGVDSEAGRGSSFWFSLNLEISPLLHMPSPPILPDVPNVAVDEYQLARRKNFRILVAEDNKVNQMIAMSMMEALGYSATLAENGEEAVQHYLRSEFDLILMDQHMPVMDGMQASAEIRKREQETNRRVPIIAFTATIIQEEQKNQFEKLMDGFILKPVTLEALENVLADWEDRLKV